MSIFSYMPNFIVNTKWFVRFYNQLAKMRGEHPCDLCGDSRGGIIGNGQYPSAFPNLLMCDYCTADYLINGEWWDNLPPTKGTPNE